MHACYSFPSYTFVESKQIRIRSSSSAFFNACICNLRFNLESFFFNKYKKVREFHNVLEKKICLQQNISSDIPCFFKIIDSCIRKLIYYNIVTLLIATCSFVIFI